MCSTIGKEKLTHRRTSILKHAERREKSGGHKSPRFSTYNSSQIIVLHFNIRNGLKLNRLPIGRRRPSLNNHPSPLLGVVGLLPETDNMNLDSPWSPLDNQIFEKIYANFREDLCVNPWQKFGVVNWR